MGDVAFDVIFMDMLMPICKSQNCGADMQHC